VSVVIGLLGDIYLDHATGSRLQGVDLGSGDLWFANLEAPFSRAGDKQRQHRAWASGGGFKIDPTHVNELRGLSAVSIANNHALDFGMDAYFECVKTLDDAGIGHAGGGRNEKEAREPAYFERNGQSVAFLAYTCLFQDGWSAGPESPGMSTITVHTSYEAPLRVFEQPGYPPIVRTRVDPSDAARVAQEVRLASSLADAVIVSVHWGLSVGQREVVDYQLELGTLLLDAGASAVFGHHPHALQPVILHGGKPIFLSLGNIVFDYEKAWRGSSVTAAARVGVKAGIVTSVSLMPLVRDEAHDPVLARGSDADAVAERLFPTGPDRVPHSFDGERFTLDLSGNGSEQS
jgi:poly-gamma-glutamate capsule biosynthesis protein CapA/YwtB (metallophosphatase superfamily)